MAGVRERWSRHRERSHTKRHSSPEDGPSDQVRGDCRGGHDQRVGDLGVLIRLDPVTGEREDGCKEYGIAKAVSSCLDRAYDQAITPR